jgi:hypothetical protein
VRDMGTLVDRRRARRRLTYSELVLFHRGIPVAARLLDLSESGARLETTEHLRQEMSLFIVLAAPGRGSLTLTARVRFSREGSGAGLAFTRLTARQRRRLSELLQALSSPA